MSRTARIVLALVVGFVAAGAVIIAASVDRGDDDEGPVVRGTVDAFVHCEERYGPLSQALVVGSSAFGWNCTNRSNGLFRLEGIDFTELCRRAYGSEVEARARDHDDPYSWECIEP